MDWRSRLRERASSRSPRRRVPALGRESLVRQNFPRYPWQSMFNGHTLITTRRQSIHDTRKYAHVSFLLHNKYIT